MKILHLEDNAQDAELTLDFLQAEWPDIEVTWVVDRPAFVAALQAGGYDMILSDFQLPGFNGVDALHIAQEYSPELPLIFLSGTIGEERAVEAVRAGAADYVIKDRIRRLPIAMRRVFNESKERAARQQSEAELAQERHLQRVLMENVPDHVYFKDADSRFLRVSRSMAADHGLAPEQLVGKTDFDLYAVEHASKAREDEVNIMDSGFPLFDMEEMEIRLDGVVRWVRTSKMPLRDRAGAMIGTFGVSRDITERKEDAERIRKQAEIIGRAPISIVIADLEHRVTYCNDGAVALFGVKRSELLGCKAEQFFTPESMRQLASGRDAALARGYWTGEVPIMTQAGRHVYAEFHMSLIRNSEGEPTARLSIAVDITEKKKIEEQLLRAQRLEGLGMLAAGIAHDLNNVLAPVMMGAPLLRGRTERPSDLRMLETIEKSATRGAALVRQILSFAHGASGEKVVVQSRHLLRDITELIQSTFSKEIVLEHHLPKELWTLMGNPTHIHQVILNLCVNARDAMPNGGTLKLRAENRHLTASTLPNCSDASPGAYVEVEVSDTGTGITPETLARIWEPFFTTKDKNKGTGLGLSTVRGIVANHGGFVHLESELGRGTTFKVYLPAVASGDTEPAEIKHQPDAKRARIGQGELVLVVDDEASIRRLGSSVLSRAGYRVVTAENGVDAMERLSGRVSEIDLIVSDLQMPGMNGLDFMVAFRKLNPTAKFLLMSGAADDPNCIKSLPPEAGSILPKPFTVESLLGAVRERLEK